MGYISRTKILTFGVALALAGVIISGCQPAEPISSGVSLELAQHRKAAISEINYNLSFDIPAEKSSPIEGRAVISFNLSRTDDVVLDFKEKQENILSVNSGNGGEYRFENGHIVIPALQTGSNEVTIEFITGDLSLNRNEEFLYTLFVPDRASTAFPCFDQPNLKATYDLILIIPQEWSAIANGELLSQSEEDGKSVYQYNTTEPISTYLFAFVAGKFETLTRTEDGLTMTMLHRETDSAKVARNVDAIFDLHISSIRWLEDYTGIDYPFQKFGFALIPSFQYGGMEHPGAIHYRAASLFHEEQSTINQKLGRARLIAHETAHMWFGNLVTMDWFNDVWLKEVFANFMAAKVVNPNFPDVNHDLSFLMSHYPSAYGVDRTGGANPIQQKLDNLQNAGTVYGAIIYQKAPIVMRHLERMVGSEPFQLSLQQYLRQFEYGNATWDDLVAIIDDNSEHDVSTWSNTWVKSPGLASIAFSTVIEGDKAVLRANQTSEQNLWWQQQVAVELYHQDEKEMVTLDLNGPTSNLPITVTDPTLILPNPDGFTYGYLDYDANSIEQLLVSVGSIEDEVTRGTVWINLYEGMLRGKIEPPTLLNAIESHLPQEQNALITQYLLGRVNKIYWQFLLPAERNLLADGLEDLLLQELQRREASSQKLIFYRAFRNIFSTEKATKLVIDWWKGEESVEGMQFSERDNIVMAMELAVRGVNMADSIVEAQINAIKNEDRRARMTFVSQALSSNAAERATFFESLKDASNREHEPWVLEALSYLHHPLRQEDSKAFLKPSLELLQEIQLTGDIFFPKRWLDNTFGTYQSAEAVEIVNQFLLANPNYSAKLKEKILQSVDNLYRANEIVEVNRSL